ncbi:MAG: Heavy-metal-associated domain protein [Candidatus Brocadia sinica]|uniref:HMA domain-containing protein n=1 Tax=Candidatus Brocadia sinica JPN1 TaxID=1197129 RepID=A0ABQ0JUA6_9BACT|nr:MULTISPECIES: heavy-metal-associated domain-containing protein [Brocadia]KXK29838.1 MAG: Heavy-metal-associated domain protein [Candidatus Brocadia sinica]NOG41822.1 heavy-metal-associated domain-containing protein [Planctomycetota bacterium]GAN32290.1 hypothetical protein BROSI_A0802 [Candidatus Brocadia sinica JPN1]GIK14160.1 MAG: hypothetical protein BroJett002_28670 [Candidatus Brocadia sinica]GJQ17915.1 MAG: hypothetical protein HBSIN01_18740 [Candidatus Brocadia sinica]
MKIACKYKTILLLLLSVSFVLFNTISNKLYACGGGGSSPDGITLKLRGVNDLAEAIQLKATLQKNEAIKCANISPHKTEICISTLCPGAITEEQIIKAIKDAGYDASLPDYLTFKIDNFIHESDVKRLRECLDELPGVTTANIDLNTKDITINYYEGWIRFARKIVKTLEDNGFKAIVPIDTITFETEGMAEVDAHDVRAYLLGIFGVSGSDVDIGTNEVKVSFYRGWTTKEKLIKTIEERGNTKVKHDLMVLKTS